MENTHTSEGSRMERKKDETRRKIVAAAMALFKTQGLEGATMEQIADQAELPGHPEYAQTVRSRLIPGVW